MSQLFLCIGAARSGTTWLYENLRKHPDIFLPPVKELRHFYSNYSAEERKHHYTRLISKVRRSEAEKDWLNAWLHMDNADDKAYLDLLQSPSKTLSGDFSPIYSIAELKTIARIRDAIPYPPKIIYILRNPIDRDWSHVLHHLRRRKANFDALELSNFMAFLNNKNVARRSNYIANIRRWSKFFPKDNFFITFYDKLNSDPDVFVKEIYDFLDVDYKKPNIRRKVNSPVAKKTAVIEPELILKRYLAERHLPRLKVLARMHPDPCRTWLAKAQDLVREADGKRGAALVADDG